MYDCWHNYPVKEKYDYSDYTPADHVQMGIACDPLNFPLKQLYGFMEGPFSITKRCFMKKQVDHWLFTYGLDFHKKYKGKAHYSFNTFMDGHETTTLVAHYMDGNLKDYIQSLEKEKILDDTLVILVSDHGNHMYPMVELEQSKLERRNFFIHMLYPNKFLTKAMERNLKKNS